MKNFCFLLVILCFRTTINIPIKENPIFLTNNSYPFVLSTLDDYFYVITKGKDFKIDKISGDIYNISENILDSQNYIYIFDNSNNNYIFYSNKYYEIIYNPFISYKEIIISSKPQDGNGNGGNNMHNVGSIAKDNDFIIYGYDNNNLFFSSKSREFRAQQHITNINEKLSCKFAGGEIYVCFMIINNNLNIRCLTYQIFQNSNQDSLTLDDNTQSWAYNSISSFGIFDIDKNKINTKLFCRKKIDQYTINCKFWQVYWENERCKSNTLGNGDMILSTSGDFTEKNCYFSQFNSEYLFCCGIMDLIKCYKFNISDYRLIKEFDISIPGDNSYLTIKSNNHYATLFFMNIYNNKNSVYEYYIYLPTCQNKDYTIFVLNNTNESKLEEEATKLINLFDVKTNKYYFEIKNKLDEFGYFTLNNKKVEHKILVRNNDYILGFNLTKNDIINGFTKTVGYIVSVEDDEAYSTKCYINFTFKFCYHSCEKCYFDINNSNEKYHNCINCNKNYYPSPSNKSNCYSIEEKEINWYLDLVNSEFYFCHEKCRSCTGPTEFNCSSCYNGYYLDNNSCKSNCSEGYFPIKIEIDSNYYYICHECYQNCKTCREKGDAHEMKCLTCKDNQIKYNENCFYINNSSIKSFYVSENNNFYITSCFEEFEFYIKEDSNICIPLPNEEEGYYLSNNKTGLLSKCHDNCFSCSNGPIRNTSGNIQSMECNSCKDSNSSLKTMIKFMNNCFKIILYDESKIIFNISEFEPNNPLGTCKNLGKAIYYNYYECIDKPDNTYYVLNNTENTGVIKNCSEACNTCLGEGNSNDTNCSECAQGYFKTEDSDTHCLINDSISLYNYYFNISDNIYYHCYPNCKGCNGSYNPNTKDMHCLDCINGYYFIYGENNCYNFTLLQEKEYYFNTNDSEFHKCYHTCSKCLNFEPNETNHSCIKCISGYYFLENSSNCYDMNITEKGYYLDNINITIEEPLFKKCYNSCKTCVQGIIYNSATNEETHNCKECADNYYIFDNTLYPYNCYDNETINILKELKKSTIINADEQICLNNTFITSDGKCVLTCPSGTFHFSLNNSCLDSCPPNYEINKNKCLISSFGLDMAVNDFKNQIKNDISSYVNSSKVINGSNFLAVVLSSDDINPEDQLKNGISTFDLGNCTNVIKEYYNIPKDENLIIFNIETKNEESQKNESSSNNKAFNLGKSTQLEIYDFSGRKLNLSVCKEDIKVMKYIGDAEGQLDMESAKSLSNQGIDVFNANDDFFNDICHPYDNSDGIDIIINDRRNDIYQDATFCQDGCTYNGIDYNLKAANCICDSSILQEEYRITNIEKEQKENKFKSLTDSFISNLIDFNFDILRCYNLALNTKILIHNIGFYCQSLMFILQLIFFLVYLIKKLKSLRNFMLIFKINNHINNLHTSNDGKLIKNIIKSTPPPKNNYSIQNIENVNEYHRYPNKKKKTIKRKFKKRQTIILKDINDDLNSKNNIENISNKKALTKRFSYSINNKLKNINSKDLLNNFSLVNDINNHINKENFYELTNLCQDNNNKKIYNIKFVKKNIFGKKEMNDAKIEAIHEINNSYIKSHVNKGDIIKLMHKDSDIQDLDYKEAIIYDKRSFLRMYWGYLVDSQIILGTFCTDNYLDLFVIKLSFFVFTFQISFFLNALFYTDEYISDAYHNDGVLDFVSGLPKSIYSFIATLITTNLLRMLSSSKSELMKVIRRNDKFSNYSRIINIKLKKLGKKIIIYFILVFLLESFFLYYVTVFCAVYRYSQKYWFMGCLESFGMDSLVSFITCIFLALFRYISIKTHIKCFYIFANIINTFL